MEALKIVEILGNTTYYSKAPDENISLTIEKSDMYYLTVLTKKVQS